WQPEEMQALLDKLEEVRLQPGRATNKQHVAHVKELQAGKAQRRKKPMVEPMVEPEFVKPPAPDTVDIALELEPAPAPVPPPVVKPLPEPEATPTVNEVPVCPQCEWPLRKLLMQRGPLAGQGIWRCTNSAGCSFVRAAES
ncbi:MAG: NERD domain-containing protein, partial [Comamonas sp.]